MFTTKNTLFAFVLVIAVSLLNAQSSRHVNIINNCKQSYYFSVTPAAAPFNPPSLRSCTNDGQCITGAYCNVAATVCFWNTPMPDNGNYLVSAGGSNKLTLPFINNGADIHWSGNFAFCYNASCSASADVCYTQGCNVVYGPSNIPEITMQKQNSDFYDISNIGGVNVAVSVGPTKSQLGANSIVAGQPYTCTAAGSVAGENGLGASPWSFTPPYQQNIYVVGNGHVCTTDKDCSGGQRCGVSNVPGRTPQFQMQCGDFYGYWTANAVCAQDPTNSLNPSPFNCAQTVQNGPFLATYKGLYLCTGDSVSGSGYSVGATTSACGCVDWWKMSNNQLVPSSTTPCANTNPIWVAKALPHLTWLKNACPSCYTYPFDDMSSTFTCGNNVNNGYNTLDYTITLCPAN